MSDDDLERRLRALFDRERLSLLPRPDALEIIHRGARRRQARRVAAASTGAALAAVLVVAASTMIRPAAHRPTTTAPTQLTVPSASSPAASPSSTTAEPISTQPPTIPAGGPPPRGFVPLSVTGTTSNGQTFWVLGHAPCGAGSCTALAKTTDGGRSFTEVAAPPSAVVPDVIGALDVFGPQTIADVRFVDAHNGWAYGGALWQTSDGGHSWQRVTEVPGNVEQLAVASGHVWAVVTTGSGPDYRLYTSTLYTATYPGGRWAPVEAADTFGPAEPALVVHDTTVVVIGQDATTGRPRAVGTTNARNFTTLPAPPCLPAHPSTFSVTADAVWLACAANAPLYVSTDFGQTWTAVPAHLPAVSAVAAVDPTQAVVATGGELRIVHVDGTVATAVTPGTADGFVFVGFVNAQVGFAVAETGGARQLWRTTDAGQHWSVVSVGG